MDAVAKRRRPGVDSMSASIQASVHHVKVLRWMKSRSLKVRRHGMAMAMVRRSWRR
jgi:hypothetical protein